MRYPTPYEVLFANGDSVAHASLKDARHAIRARNIDTYRDVDVLPAEISKDGVLIEKFTSWADLNALP